MRASGMDDVIFSGVATRPKRNFAEVVLEIDNNKVQSIMDVSKLITMSTSDLIDFQYSSKSGDSSWKYTNAFEGVLSNLQRVL